MQGLHLLSHLHTKIKKERQSTNYIIYCFKDARVSLGYFVLGVYGGEIVYCSKQICLQYTEINVSSDILRKTFYVLLNKFRLRLK